MVSGTDLRILAPRAQGAFSQTIRDGGSLRPLTAEEQGWVLEAALEKGNTEAYLIQLFMLSTGARIESVCTLRMHHFIDPLPHYSGFVTDEYGSYRLKAGPGTGVDTKNNKSGILHVPKRVYKEIHTYIHSQRASVRRARYVKNYQRDPGLDAFVFLTSQGNPYYESKSENFFNANKEKRHTKSGQTLRQFIKDHAVPYIRENYDARFAYRPHDLRGSFGMNMTALLMRDVEDKKRSLHSAQLLVKELMWHEYMKTTEGYLQYRSKNAHFVAAVNGYGTYLSQLIDAARGQGVRG